MTFGAASDRKVSGARAGLAGGVPADAIVTGILVLAFFVLVWPVFRHGNSADLLAVWSAGLAMEAGASGQVYPPATVPFTMLPPQPWLDRLRAEGFDGEVYPFLYPPLWAWAMGKLSAVASYDTIRAVASVANPLMLAATVLLAHRIAAPAMRRSLFVLVGLLLLMLPPVGMIALFQNQPQILVSFLTVLALERALHGQQRAAGVALAVAAAIKLYPVLFALLWLASGKRRAFGAFCLTGAGLAAASVAVAGWPLHETFLHLIAGISRSVLITPISYTLDAVIAQVAMTDSLAFVVSPDDPDIPGAALGWHAMAKPPLMALAGQVAQLAALAVFARMLMRRPGPAAEAAIWPLAMTVLALLGPVSWGYHYIAPVAFAPMIFDRMRPRPATALILGCAVLVAMPRQFVSAGGWPPNPLQLLGTLGIAGLALGFVAIRNRPSRSAAAGTRLS